MQAIVNAHLKTPLVQNRITATLIEIETERLASLRAVAGNRCRALQRQIENKMAQLSRSYGGGHWYSYALSNGGFYTTPNPLKNIEVDLSCEGMSPLSVSADTAGIIACALAYSHLALSLSLCEDRAQFAAAYTLLSEYIFQHPDVDLIRAVLH